MDSDNIIQNLSQPLEPLSWSEGLAMGAENYIDEWRHNPTFYSLHATSGSTTMSRATANGIVTGKIVETAFFYQAYSVDATDMMRFIITNDGSTNNLSTALFLPEGLYTTMGAAYGHKVGCRMNAE